MISTLGKAEREPQAKEGFVCHTQCACKNTQMGAHMIFIDYRDARPIYEQVTDRFKMMILRGVLCPDEKIPSVRSLAVDLSINPNTIQRAYSELERQGYIYTVKGKGNFVADDKELFLKYKEELLAGLKDLCRSAFEAGITEEEIIQSIKGEKASD